MTTIVARPHPLRSECYSAEIPDGATLYETFGDLPVNVFAQVDGEVWSREDWSTPLPADGVVTLYANPEDDIGRAVAIIAVAVLAAYTGGAAAAAFGGVGTTTGALAGAAASAAVTLAGNLAVNALIPPASPEQAGAVPSPNVRQSLTGTRNQTDPYGVVPRVYGNPRWYPKLAANPVTEIAGNDQYLRMLLCLGYGPLEVAGRRVGAGYARLNQSTNVGDAIRIGETEIGQYDDVEWEIGTASQLSLDYADIDEEAVGVALSPNPDYEDDVWVYDGVSATRTTASNTKEISLDLVFPQGLFSINSKGSTSETKVEFRIEYRPTGSDSWIVKDSAWIIDGPTKDTKRVNRRWKVSQGQYDVRVTRNRSFHGGKQAVYSDCQWSVLRSVQPGPAYKGDHVLLALRIRATDQLNGVIDQLNVKTQAVLRVYNGSSFSLQATSNPAWAYLDALTGEQVGRPVSDGQIDIASIREWALFCGTQGLSYHWVHDASETLFERAKAIASTGQASFALQDGLFGVVRDNPNEPVVQAISPRNAIGFSSSRQFQDMPHALRVKYIDPDTWSDAERIVYRDGYNASNATRFEDFQTQGVASAAEAYHHGMYHIRQAILRPETHRVQMDWENLAVMRGNRVALAYDVISVGLGQARVTSVSGLTITLDETVQYETSRPYGVRVRGHDGPQATTVVTSTNIGETNELTLSDPIDVQVGDLVLYGVLDKESIDCKVSKIEHGGDFTADLTLVPAATDIYDFSSAPDFDPGITHPIPVDQIRPPVPKITAVRGDESASHRNPDGSFQTLIRVSYAFSAQAGLPSLEIEARYRVVGQSQWQKAGPFTPSGTLTIRDVQDGQNYEIQVRARNGALFSDWSQNVTLLVTGQAVSAPLSVDVREGTFEMVLIPQGVYAGSQWEFFRSTLPLALGDVETSAVRLGVGMSWTDVGLEPDTTYYYWIRGWTVNFTSSFYALAATTDNDPGAIMSVISGEIKQDDLFPALGEKIDSTAQGVAENAAEVERIDGRVDGVQSTLTSETARLDGRVSSVQQSLQQTRDDLEVVDGELADRLDAAESAIVSEQEARETEDGFIAERLDGLTQTTGQHSVYIGQLQRVQQEGEQLDAIIYEALNVETANRTASIRTEERVRVDGDSALAARSDALEAEIDQQAARITTEQQARVDGDSVLASQIGELSAKVDALPQFASGFEAGTDFNQWVAAGTDTLTAETGNVYGGMQSALLTSTASAPASSGATGVTHAPIPAGASAAFEGYEVTVRVAAVQPDASASTEFAVAYSTNGAGDSGWHRFTPTTSWQVFEFSYVVPEGGSGTTDHIAIWADTSGAGLGVIVDAVSVKRVAGEILEITAAIEAEQQARVEGDQALASDLSALQAEVDDNTAGLVTEQQARASADSAMASDITALRADVDGNMASITAEQTTRADADQALSSQLTSLSARTGQVESGLTSEQNARTSADAALASRLDTVESTTGDTTVALQEEVQTRVEEDEALAQAQSILTLTTQQQSAAIRALERLRQEGDEIEAIQFESINVGTASSRAGIQTEQQARVEDGAALAQQISTVQAELGDEIASVQQLTQASIDTQTGRIDAMWTLRLDANGYVSGIGLSNDGDESQFAVRADQFYIAQPGLADSEVIPFIVDDGTTYLKEALIQSLVFTKLRDGQGTFIFEDGKLKAEYIDVEQLVVKRGQSDNYVPGQQGWLLTPTGGEINSDFTFRGVVEFSQVNGAGALASKDSVSYSEIAGTKPPSDADRTASNTAYDTSRVAGTSASTVRDRANNGNSAKSRVDYWTRPGSTRIDGNRIYTGDAYVDTLQIKGQAVTVPVSSSRTSTISNQGSWKDTLSISFNPEGGRAIAWFSASVSGYSNTYWRWVVNGSVKYEMAGNDPSIQGIIDAGTRNGTVTIKVQSKRAYGNTGVNYCTLIGMGAKR